MERSREPLLPHVLSALSTRLQCVNHVRSALDAREIDGFDVEARLLCEWALACTTLDFVTNPNAPALPEQVQTLLQALEQRLAGMPVHRIMGERDFYGLRFKLSSATLEPRPDTETLVDQVLDFVAKSGKSQSSLRILDLGTGTGAIALALLSKLPSASALATDLAPLALETALYNAQANGLSDRFEGFQSDWFTKIEGVFDVIVSNPPYIRSDIIGTLDVEVREHDPVLALDGGPDGLAPYREIARNAASYLKQDGMVFVEIGYDQASDIETIFRHEGYALIELRQDLGGRDRAMAFQVKNT